MRQCISRLAFGIGVAVFAIGAPLASAQQRPNTPPRVAVPNTAPAAQAAAARPATPSAEPTTTSSIPASGSNWRVECSTDGQVLDCRALQQVMVRDNNQTQLAAGLTIRVPAETKKPVMMVQMPLGILVSEGVDFIIDDGKPERLNVQTCNQHGCFVGTVLPDAVVTAMRAGKQLKLVFQNANKQAITVTMPLTGFALAFDKAKS